MRRSVPFNDAWRYCPRAVADEADDGGFEPVTLPHANVVLPPHNFDDREYQFVSTYRRRFELPEPLAGRRVLIEFEGAMTCARVAINGHGFPEHQGGFVPFVLDLTDWIRAGGENLLTVGLDSTERPGVPPFGGTVDYLVFGGLYREVTLHLVEPVHIDDVFVQPRNPLAAAPVIDVDVRLRNLGEREQDLLVECWLEEVAATTAVATTAVSTTAVSTTAVSTTAAVGEPASQLAKARQLRLRLPPGSTQVCSLRLEPLQPLALWSLDQPRRYRVLTRIGDQGQRLLDSRATEFGVREARFRDDGFYLNGERVQLMGLNRHQTFPFIGAAAPARLQRRVADILKFECGVNMVRTSHYPQSRHFLQRCDEIGLLVFEEIPGWQHIGDQAWQALSLRDLRVMIERDRNHPSIVLWGVRINESRDASGFYQRTNDLARRLDPTRQTGGVRYIADSEFLEDVFTFNDFSNGIREPGHRPYLVTEYNGHMFPTKPWDHDARRVEHAIRHLHVQDRARAVDGVCGAIGWCAFDYNTHKEFGAGDRVCYHGVMDMFRLPKYAMYAYSTQLADPRVQPVLKIASNWKPGDYDRGDSLLPVTVLTNCDAVEAYVGGKFQGRFLPDRAAFPHLPHPPIRLDGLDIRLARPWGDLRVVGFVDGRAVIEQSIDADGVPARLELTLDDAELWADGSDMTRVVFRILDRHGNVLPYANAVVTLAATGPADLIGDRVFPLVGGQAALYLRARREPGEVEVTATTPRLAPASARLWLRQA